MYKFSFVENNVSQNDDNKQKGKPVKRECFFFHASRAVWSVINQILFSRNIPVGDNRVALFLPGSR